MISFLSPIFFLKFAIFLFINKNVESKFGTEPRAYWTIIIFTFLFQITPSDVIIRTTYLPQFGDVYFILKKQYKILLNIAKKKFF